MVGWVWQEKYIKHTYYYVCIYVCSRYTIAIYVCIVYAWEKKTSGCPQMEDYCDESKWGGIQYVIILYGPCIIYTRTYTDLVAVLGPYRHIENF